MKIAMTGSSGLIGSALASHLRAAGHTILHLTRRPRPVLEQSILWDIEKQQLDPVSLEGLHAVVHLAGEPVTGARWTAEKKARIRNSRVLSTQLLSMTLAKLQRPPPVLICASAIGIYGDRNAELLTESSTPGTGFLAEVCQAWEGAADSARERAIRTVHVRIGMVLSSRGGALASMRLPFKLGLGGRFGSGDQYLSWIALEDLIHIFDRVIQDTSLTGTLNAVSPTPVTNRQFTGDLSACLHRPAWLPMSAWVLRLGLGEFAKEVLLSSQRVIPARLQAANFSFLYPDLVSALRASL